MKALIASHTAQLAAVQFIIGLLALTTASFGQFIPASILGVVAMVKSCLDIWLRMNTATPIGGIVSVK